MFGISPNFGIFLEFIPNNLEFGTFLEYFLFQIRLTSGEEIFCLEGNRDCSADAPIYVSEECSGQITLTDVPKVNFLLCQQRPMMQQLKDCKL